MNKITNMMVVLIGLAGQMGLMGAEPAGQAPEEIKSDPLVYYYSGNRLAGEIQPSGVVTGATLPQELFIPPGIYQFGGKAYRLEKEGLYRFVYFGQKTLTWQRIIYRSDLDGLLSSLSWLGAYGHYDKAGPEQLAKIACERKILTSAGFYSAFAVEMLKRVGIKARVVRMLTLNERNSFNNTHTMVEVYRPAEKWWAIYDLTQGLVPKQDDHYLTVLEFCEVVSRGEKYDLTPLNLGGVKAAVGEYPAGGQWDPGLFAELRISSEQVMRAWYRRVAGVPFVEADGVPYFCDAANRVNVEGYYPGYRYMEKAEFIKRYYGE